MTENPDEPTTFPMRGAARMAGVTPERLRAWEARHGAIVPARSPGGSRRYSSADLERIRALRRAVEAGRRIAEIAQIETAALIADLEVADRHSAPGSLFDQARDAILTFDADRLRSLFVERGERDGWVPFACADAMAFVADVGQSWVDGALPVACEHFATDVLRTLLLEALADFEVDVRGPRIVFATTPGERHDLGLLAAALVAAEQGASVVFVGADVPEDDLARALAFGRVEAIALGYVVQPAADVERSLKSLRRQIPNRVAIWAGGRGIEGVAPVKGVDRVPTFDRLRAFVLAARASEDASSSALGAS